MFTTPIWSSPVFNPSADIITLLNGVVIGGVGVLPPTSMITYCQKNSSEIYDQALVVYDKFTTY
jgi:hypothetical protein